ncbi:MAG: hypothetical protein ACLPN6_20170 [Streptosporangiaceae bacterium]|nr:hypothetical protein [Actinomycetota bacterium]
MAGPRRADRDPIAREQAHHLQQLLDKVTMSLYQVGLNLQAAADLPGELAGQYIADALMRLDETIREIRDSAFSPARDHL